MSNKLNMLSISDIHLGNNLVPAEFIIDNLNTLVPDNKTMLDIDIIWLAGDIFDQILLFPDGEVGQIELWMTRLLRICKKWDVLLRVLEGTPSHDRKQSKHFIIINDCHDIGADVKYIDTLAIEYISRFDINVLYIPDEYHATTMQTWYEVKDLLAEHGLEKVDYAIMHGMFEHQIPKGLKLQSHIASNYLSIVNKYIFIGHVHLMSVFERILAQGSTDRLCHGEEEPKGIFRVTSYKNNFDNDKIEFIINERAKIFKTISILNVAVEDVSKALDVVKDLPDNSYVRIEVENLDQKLSTIAAYKLKYPKLTWSILKVKDSNSHDISVRLTTYQPVPINVNTIEGLVLEKLRLLGYDDNRCSSVISLLQTIK